MTYVEARWGLQWIAEEGYGRQVAAARDEEDVAFAAAAAALTGGRTQ